MEGLSIAIDNLKVVLEYLREHLKEGNIMNLFLTEIKIEKLSDKELLDALKKLNEEIKRRKLLEFLNY